jgi:hypothetical protein
MSPLNPHGHHAVAAFAEILLPYWPSARTFERGHLRGRRGTNARRGLLGLGAASEPRGTALDKPIALTREARQRWTPSNPRIR